MSFFWTNPHIIQRIENNVIDSYFQLNKTTPPKNNPIVIVGIDKKSILKEGAWPWSRTKIAALIQKISDQKARTIATDLLFSDTEVNVLTDAKHWFQQHQIQVPKPLIDFETHASGDSLLAQTIRKTPTVTAYYADISHTALPKPEEALHDSKKIKSSAYKETQLKPINTTHIKKVYRIRTNVIGNASLYSGFLNFMSDSSDSIRHVPLLIQYQDHFFPPLSLAALQHWKGNSELHANISDKKIIIHFADEEITASPQGMFRIQFYSDKHTFTYISATDILSGKTTTKDFSDQLVLIGVTAEGVEKTYNTPYNHHMHTVEIHAHTIANFLNHQNLQHTEQQVMVEIILITVIALLYAFFSYTLVNQYFGAISNLLLVTMLLIGYIAFTSHMIIYVVLPTLEIICCFILLTIVNYTTELRERLRLRHTFESFIDPAIVTDVVDHQHFTELSGDERYMSVMFVDVAGFTSISEMLSPQETVQYINHFFQEATPVIFKHKGAIDRLTGDGLIVLFGAPIHDEEHAERACKTALELQQVLNKVRNIFSDIKCPLNIRVGINSGNMVVGNIGSKHRLHYTFMGDAGNTAARLESLNKQYASQRMIGEKTWQEVHHDFTCRELDTVILVGKTTPITVYELLGEKNKFEHWEPMIESYASALALYRRGYFKEAALIFRSGGERFEDLVSLHMAKRCDTLHTHPMPQWNGIWIADRK